MRRALAILTAEYTNKPASAEAAVDMADVLLAENREDEAGQMLSLAEEIFETSLGPGSLLTTGVAARKAVVLKQPASSRLSTPNAYRVGGLVTVPRILSKVEPEYSAEARKNKLQGSILLTVVIDASGAPTQIAVLRPLGMGLDEAAYCRRLAMEVFSGREERSSCFGLHADRNDLPSALAPCVSPRL